MAPQDVSDTSHYHAFLLRLWRDGDTTPWRATVQDTRTGERLNFATLQLLLTFLERQTGEALSKKVEDE